MKSLTPLSGTSPKNDVPQISHFDEKSGIDAARKRVKEKAIANVAADKFPVDAFPDKIQAIIHDVVTNLKAVPDFFGSALLFSSSIAIGNRFRIRIKEKQLQSAALFIALVGKPNTGKSLPFKIALEPFEKFEEDLEIQYKEAYRAYEQACKEYDLLSKEEKANLPKPVEPVYRQHLVGDITFEALAKALADNPEGLGLFSDELNKWFKDLSRYHKEGGVTPYLEIYDNTLIKVNRIGRGCFSVRCPFLSIGGGIQPRVLKKFGESNDENGFVERMLFAFPSGLRKEIPPDTGISPDTPVIWHNIIAKLLSVPLKIANAELNIPEPRLLWLSTEARAKYKGFLLRNAELCNIPENEPFAASWGKLDMQVCRLALIMELLQFACSESNVLPTEISGLAMERAIKLAEYYRVHNKRAISLIYDINPLEGLPTNYQKFYHALPEQFQRKEAVLLGNKFGIRGGTLARFLDNKNFFERVRVGVYAKKV